MQWDTGQKEAGSMEIRGGICDIELQHLTQGAPEQLSQFRDTIIMHIAHMRSTVWVWAGVSNRQFWHGRSSLSMRSIQTPPVISGGEFEQKNQRS